MKFHVKNCKNIHCHCHELEEVYDFGVHKVYDPNLKYKLKGNKSYRKRDGK